MYEHPVTVIRNDSRLFVFRRGEEGSSAIFTRISFRDRGIVRVTHTAGHDRETPECVFTVPGEAASFACRETEDGYLLEGPDLTVGVCRRTGRLTFRTSAGEVLLRTGRTEVQEKPVVLYDYDGEEVRFEESVDGVRARTRAGTPRVDRMGLTGRQFFTLEKDEAVYGLGSHEEGFGNLRGKTRALYQHNLKACVPAVVSVKGWELVFAMGGLMNWKDDAEGAEVWTDCADAYDFYFLYGDGSYRGVMGRYAALTGKTPMLPPAVLGYVQSKERYKDAEELIAVVREYREKKIPLDMIVLDWMSWPDGQWGWKHFDPSRFPDPGKMIRDLHDMDVKFMISIWPTLVGDANEDRKEMLEKGYMLPNQTNYNAFDPAARETYWKQAREGLLTYGVDAWWCDCSEPFEADWHGNVKAEECERIRINTDEARKYLDPTALSLYSFWHSKGISDGWRRDEPEKRLINLTRSSWVGQHRFGTVVWNGDTAATWETLRRQIPEGLNYCATGEAWWTVDAGAFFVTGRDPWFWHGDFDGGVDDPGYRELYTRWMQFAACLPVTRSHGTDTPREVWRFGEKGEIFREAVEKAIRFRYTLFPYLYSLMAETAFDGVPPMRVPALVFPEDPALRSVEDELMIGNDILVRPVTEPVLYGPGGKELSGKDGKVPVRLPAGAVWYDWETGKRYEGGQTILYEAPIDRIPVFVRGGSVLPLAPVCQHTGEAMKAPLEIVIRPGADGSFTLYEDSGEGLGYENGEYAKTVLTWDDEKRELRIGARTGSFVGMIPDRKAAVRLLSGPAKEIVLGAREQTVRFE